MGWQNNFSSWNELERKLSDNHKQHPAAKDYGLGADGGDAPAWSYSRSASQAAEVNQTVNAKSVRGASTVAYAELHCHSSFSFLDGASQPEELVAEAVRLGLKALAITDHNGFYGVVRFAEAARAVGLPTVFGAELALDKLDVSNNQIDPDGVHLLVLARDPTGYAGLSRVISQAQLKGQKGSPRLSLSDLNQLVAPEMFNHWLVLTGCRKGAVPRALEQLGPAAALESLNVLVEQFGRENVLVEIWDHGAPLDSVRNEALVDLAFKAGVEIVATNNVHYATPAKAKLAAALASVRARKPLNSMQSWLPSANSAHLRSGDEQAVRFARFPGVVERAAEVALGCAFDLSLVAPQLPPYECPEGLNEMGFLRKLTEAGAQRFYGSRTSQTNVKAWRQIDSELALIEQLGFAGYFLVVWDIVEFCNKNNILCQGRGSAANSAVCFSLGVTKADAVKLKLLFERFLSPERDGPPDIDLDIESGRREEVIQYVYERYGRHHAAQVANIITYRTKSSVRDAAKALGYTTADQNLFSKSVDRWTSISNTQEKMHAKKRGKAKGRRQDKTQSSRQDTVQDKTQAKRSGESQEASQETSQVLPDDIVELASQIQGLPRHLGIHSGGMVICDRPVIEVCPIEHARMKNRTVLQWDKDDCAAAGLVKFDLLGLGMLSAIHYALDMISEYHKTDVDLAKLEQEDAVYAMLCRADTIGVFQVESRAQMSTLPRLKPRTFYDLVVEIALIRPGPIQGGSVHPYIRRRNGLEPVSYLHPLLENALEKTLGIPLFQEQLMQIAIDVADFSAGEADQLRQALGSKRSQERMLALKKRFHDGALNKGINVDIIEQIWLKLAAFANYGFPESHSVSFAYIVYASSWLKLHYPAAFCAALLRAQPMGFYSPHSLVQDARRHGVMTLKPSINLSKAVACLETEEGGPGLGQSSSQSQSQSQSQTQGRDQSESRSQSQTQGRDQSQSESRSQSQSSDQGQSSDQSQGRNPSQGLPIMVEGSEEIAAERRDHGWALRLGLNSVRHVSDKLAEQIEAQQPFSSIKDLTQRVDVPKKALEALATADAFSCLSASASASALDGVGKIGAAKTNRRQALWEAGALAETGKDTLAGITTGLVAPQLPFMNLQEEAVSDLWATGIASDGHPTKFVRQSLDRRGVLHLNRLTSVSHGAKVFVAGVVTHRQRPATALGTIFFSLEDETGLANVVVSKGCWVRFEKVARNAPALIVKGRVERQEKVVNVIAERLEPLDALTTPARDFR